VEKNLKWSVVKAWDFVVRLMGAGDGGDSYFVCQKISVTREFRETVIDKIKFGGGAARFVTRSRRAFPFFCGDPRYAPRVINEGKNWAKLIMV
jgi:hypothetical protein